MCTEGAGGAIRAAREGRPARRVPDTPGEAIGLCGTGYIDDVDVLTDWIDGSPSAETIAAIEALEPITVKKGETILNLEFKAYVR